MSSQKRAFATVEAFDAKLEQFLADHDGPLTLTGLVLGLGLRSKQALAWYEDREEFAESVKYAKLHVEHSYEKRLHENSCAGAIFALKNMGWDDKRQVELEGLHVTISGKDARV